MEPERIDENNAIQEEAPQITEFQKLIQSMIQTVSEPERKLTILAYQKIDACIAQDIRKMKAFIERKTKARDFETAGTTRIIRGSHKIRSYQFFAEFYANGAIRTERLTKKEARFLAEAYRTLRSRLRANPVISDAVYFNAIKGVDKFTLELSIFISPKIRKMMLADGSAPFVVLHYPDFAKAYLNRYRELAAAEGITLDRFRCRTTEQDAQTGNDSICEKSYEEDLPVCVPETSGIISWESGAVSVDWTFRF